MDKICGIEQGIEQGIRAMVQTLRKLKHSDEDIVTSIVEAFGISKDEAESYL